MSQMLYYFLLMFLMNLHTKLCNSLVKRVSVIQFSVYSLDFITIFRTVAKMLQIYRGGILIWATLYSNEITPVSWSERGALRAYTA